MSANMLLDTLPETVTVDGKEFFIDSDFRTTIIFEKIILDDTISSREKVEDAIELYFIDKVPHGYKEALNAVLDFYRCGEPQSKKSVKKNGDIELKPKMIYSYEYDAKYIYGAFLEQYGIDLCDIEYLHWWKFQALFQSLKSNTRIVEIMGYRATDLNEIKNKDERKRIARMKQIYDLPTNLTREEKIAMAGAAFGGGCF